MMGSFPGNCEIVEAAEELISVQHSRVHSGIRVGDRDQKAHVLKLKYKESLEDEINQLFDAISIKTSKGLGKSNQISSSACSSPLTKSAMKKPISVSAINSPRMSLKQAFREHCISRASEMAAMKRLSKTIDSPGPSEAGRIKNLYNSVLVETPGRSGPLMSEMKDTTLEISLVPEESSSSSSEAVYQQVPKIKTINPSAQSSPWYGLPLSQNDSGTQLTQNESGKTPKIKSSNHSAQSSPRFAVPPFVTQPAQSEIAKSPKIKPSNLTAPATYNSTGSHKTQNENVPLPKKKPSKQSVQGTGSVQKETVLASKSVGSAASKMEPARKENHENTLAVSHFDAGENEFEQNKMAPKSTKASSKALSPKSGRKTKLRSVPSSSVNGNRVSKLARSVPRVKPVLRRKSSVKKTIKQDATATSDIHKAVNNNSYQNPSPLICQRCQCSMMNGGKEANQESPLSHSANHSAGVSSGVVNFCPDKPEFGVNNCNQSAAVVVKTKNQKASEKGEISQSSKSSIGEYSSSTTLSDDSSLSRSSCSNRPHMSKDERWEAIRYVKMQYGPLGLKHFNLLKKLGCGDIGTVYLAKLIGTNCLFAIKVMDNEFLARRKKMPRAQMEREILRVLDHPFLPTLFAQFVSDNLSCLVMEYCPGGDLHVLRQRQLGRCFPEPAARFYVAEVLLALEYLHMLGIIYRDLKPENILVREDGHIMLTDFDLSLRCSVSPTLLQSSASVTDPARLSGPCTESSCIEPFCIQPSCQVSCFSPRILPAAAKARKGRAELPVHLRSLPQLVAEPTDARSNSFVGTHEYLAPEIIKGEGHGAAVDWWTFGVFLYELLYGKTPFKGAGNEETLANVVLQPLKFPDSPLVSFQARDLIRSLLVKDPENRLGSEKGAAEIKQHPFFEGLNWALIRCAIPPELPDLYDFEVPNLIPQEKTSNYLECNATGEHLEFELF